MPTEACNVRRHVRFLIAAGWLWFLFALVYFSDADCDLLAFFTLAGAGLVVGIIWLLQAAAWPHLFRQLSWLFIPFLGISGCALLFTDRDLALRVALSEAPLSQCAIDVLRDPSREFPDQVGLFSVQSVWTYDGGVYFTTSSFFDQYGIAYLPPGATPRGRASLYHLYGHWYRFVWRW